MTEMLRFNTGKPKYGYFPLTFIRALGRAGALQQEWDWDVIDGIAHVLDVAAKTKYAPHNWRAGGSWTAVCESALRHVRKLLQGEWLDIESGLPHIHHIGCNLMFLIEFQEIGVGTDDRYKRPEGEPESQVDIDTNDYRYLLFQVLTQWLESPTNPEDQLDWALNLILMINDRNNRDEADAND